MDQGRRGWMLLGTIIFVCSLWMFSLPPASFKSNLIPFAAALVVGASLRFALFLLGRKFGAGPSGADASGVTGAKEAGRGMWRWIRSLARIAIACLALGLLAIDFVVLLLVFGTPNTNPSTPHSQGFVGCGVVVGLLLVHLLITKRVPAQPRVEESSAPLPAEQLAPIHAAIFAGKTSDALKLYRAATGDKPEKRIADIVNLRKMEAELKQSYPEKFSAQVLRRTTTGSAFVHWLGMGSFLIVGLLILTKLSLWSLFWLPEGLVIGAFIRGMSSSRGAGWKRAYREMRWWIKGLAWALVGLFGFVVIGMAYAICVQIAHHTDKLLLELLHSPLFDLFACGLVAGWLLVHFLQKKRRAP